MRQFSVCVPPKFFLRLFVWLALSALAQCLFAQKIQAPSLEPLFAVSAGQRDFSGRQLVEQAMRFGLSQEGSARWNGTLRKYDELRSELEAHKPLGELGLAEKILDVMYERALSRYDEFTTKIDEALMDGVYNCVSSSILYLALAKDFALDARIQETARHAFVTIYAADGTKVDVETTNPLGFAPGTKKMISQNSSGTKKFATVPKHYYSNKIEISESKAVTLPGKNLSSLNNNKHNYDVAVPLAATIYCFVTDKTEAQMCRSDFEIVCGNFASYADRNGDYETALNFIESVWDRYGKTDRLSQHYNNTAYNLALSLCEANRYADAWLMHGQRAAHLDGKTLADIKSMIYANEVVHNAKNMSPDDGIKYLQKERAAAQSLNDKKISEAFASLEQMHWAHKINVFFNTGDFLAAAALCDEALLSLPRNTFLTNVKTRSLHNHAAEAHNKSLPLINAKKYDEALALLEAALAENPTSKMIEKDIATVRKMSNASM